MICVIAFISSLANSIFASDLSTVFYSSPQRDIVIADSHCLGFFGLAGAPGFPKYCAIASNEDGKKMLLKFYDYDFKTEKISLKNVVEIPDTLAVDLFSLLEEEVLNATDAMPTPVSDGCNLEFGIRTSDWKFAGINTISDKSLAHWLGRIAGSSDIGDVKENLAKAMAIKERLSIASKKTLAAPEGYVFADLPALTSEICLVSGNLWIIKKVVSESCGAKILLYRIAVDFNDMQDFEIAIPISEHSVPQNLCALSDKVLLFSNSIQGKVSVYKFDIDSKSTVKICGDFSPDNFQITPLGSEKFIITNISGDNATMAIYSLSGEKLCGLEEKSDGVMLRPICMDNADIAVCFVKTVVGENTGVKSCTMQKILQAKFESCVYVFGADLKLKSKTDFIKGRAEKCFQSGGKLFVLVQDANMTTAKSVWSIYECTIGLAKVGQAECGFNLIIHSIIKAHYAIFFPSFTLHSLNGNTGMVFRDNIISAKKLPRIFDLVDGIVYDDDSFYIFSPNRLAKHRYTIYKNKIKSIF